MSTETERKEDKAMTNNDDARRAHDVLDGLSAGRILSKENEQLLRSFLPEPPAQMTLEEITDDVYKAWIASSGDEWVRDGITGSVISLEDWLTELHTQLKGLKDTHAAVPALPAGMRLADHEQYGRVVVSPKSDANGVCEILYADNNAEIGATYDYAHQCELTFIDYEPANPAHPEFLETEADYQKAPEGTIITGSHHLDVFTKGCVWFEAGSSSPRSSIGMSGTRRRVLRWGNEQLQ